MVKTRSHTEEPHILVEQSNQTRGTACYTTANSYHQQPIMKI